MSLLFDLNETEIVLDHSQKADHISATVQDQVEDHPVEHRLMRNKIHVLMRCSVSLLFTCRNQVPELVTTPVIVFNSFQHSSGWWRGGSGGATRILTRISQWCRSKEVYIVTIAPRHPSTTQETW